MHQQILVAFDFRSASRRALAWAAELQRTLDGRPLQVVHVLNPLRAEPDARGPAAVLSREEIAAVERKLAVEVLSVSDTADTEVVVSGAPGAAILDAARRMHIDLIVTGTHSQGPLSRVFVGSCAEYVLRHARIPVVTIREPPRLALEGRVQPRSP